MIAAENHPWTRGQVWVVWNHKELHTATADEQSFPVYLASHDDGQSEHVAMHKSVKESPAVPQIFSVGATAPTTVASHVSR